MRLSTANAWHRLAVFAVCLPWLGCQTPRPGAGGPQEPPYPPGVDARKVHLPLAQVPDAPPVPAAADLSTRPAMPQPALRRFTDGKALLDDQRYAEAVVELEKALRYDQKQYPVLRLLCISCYLAGSEAKARLYARETLKLNAADEAAWFVLGRSALKSGQKDEALRAFRSLMLCPADPAAAEYRALGHLQLGLLLDDLGYARAAVDEFASFEQSLAALTDKQRDHPELAAVRKSVERTLGLRRARALAKMGDFKAAAIAFAGPAAEAPADAALQTEYAQVLVRAGRADDAMTVARSHVKQEAASPQSIELLMAVRRWSRQESRIPDDLRALAEQYPDRLDLATMLARTLMDSGRLSAAADILKAVRQRHPEETDAGWMLADILRREKRWEEWVVALADLVTAREEQYARVEESLSQAEADLRAVTAAARRAADRAQGKANEAAVLYVAGCIARRAADEPTAERYLRRSIDVKPGQIAAPVALGEMLAAQYRWQDLIAVGHSALQACGERASAQLHWLVGCGLDGLDDWEKAVSQYRAGLEKNPKDLRTLQSFALLCERMGDFKKAQGLWKDALAVAPHDMAIRERLLRSYVARGEMAAAASQLLEMQEQQGSPSPAYRRCEALLKLLRTRSENEGGSREYREQLAELVKAFPRDVRTREDYASLLFASRKYAEAARQVDEILRLDANSLPALELRALLAVRALDYDGAAASFRELLRRFPNREGWNRSLADVYRVAMQYDQCAAVLEHLMSLPAAKPRLADYRASRLGLYELAGRIDEMRKQAEAWLAESPDDSSVRNLVRAADAAAKDYARIVARCEAWLEKDPQSALEWRGRLVEALVEMKRFAEAEARVLAWMEEAPQDAGLIRLFGEVLIGARRYDDAAEWARSHASGEGPESAAYSSLLYQARLYAKDYDGAIAVLKQAARANPNANVDGDIARVLIEAGRYDEAESHLNKLIDQADTDDEKASLLRTLAYAYQKAKRPALAEQRMREALKLAPEDIGINNDLGYTWADAGRNLDEAERMLRYAVGEVPHEAAYLDSLGWLYYKKGDFQAAVTWLSRAAAQSDGRDPVIYSHLGDALWRLKQAEAAEKRWKQALETAAERAERPLGGSDDEEAMDGVRARLAAVARGERPPVAPIGSEQAPTTGPGPSEDGVKGKPPAGAKSR